MQPVSQSVPEIGFHENLSCVCDCGHSDSLRGCGGVSDTCCLKNRRPCSASILVECFAMGDDPAWVVERVARRFDPINGGIRSPSRSIALANPAPTRWIDDIVGRTTRPQVGIAYEALMLWGSLKVWATSVWGGMFRSSIWDEPSGPRLGFALSEGSVNTGSWLIKCIYRLGVCRMGTLGGTGQRDRFEKVRRMLDHQVPLSLIGSHAHCNPWVSLKSMRGGDVAECCFVLGRARILGRRRTTRSQGPMVSTFSTRIGAAGKPWRTMVATNKAPLVWTLGFQRERGIIGRLLSDSVSDHTCDLPRNVDHNFEIWCR